MILYINIINKTILAMLQKPKLSSKEANVNDIINTNMSPINPNNSIFIIMYFIAYLLFLIFQ